LGRSVLRDERARDPGLVDSLIAILIVAALLLLNALFVAAEFAIVGTPKAAIERRAASGQRVARTVLQILEDPRRQDRFIATAQLGITVASLGLGMYGERVLAGWLESRFEAFGATRWIAAHTVASLTAVAFLTYLHIVIGEMVPKSLALQSAERTVLWITPLMLSIKTALYPFVIGLNALGNALLRPIGIDRRQASSELLYSPEELALIVEESEAGGLLRAEAGQMLRELFAFGDTTAREAMAPRVLVRGIPLGADAAEIRRIVAESPHTRYPVYEGDLDHIVGQVHIKDLLGLVEAGGRVTLSNVRPIPVVPETAPLDAVLSTLRRDGSQMAVVLDEHGGTAGVITLEDLFDEVAGEIHDEPASPQSVTRLPDGRLSVAGTVRLEEVGEALGVELEHPDVDSVSGLVMTLLGHPPSVGDTVEYDHVRFEVTAVHRHAVRRCLVSLVDDVASD
jgi:CBS domain containing-hemolysin-like protein